MAENIKNLYNSLIGIRTYLIKIGQTRRKGKISEVKLQEAKEVLIHYNDCIDKLNKAGIRDDTERDLVHRYCSDFKALYQEISQLCNNTEDEDQLQEFGDSEVSDYSDSEPGQTIIMDKFDIKVALSLLPMMTDKEDNTKELIDGIEYYNSLIAETSGIQLISFVLKTRLSQSAKLKLSSKYDKVDELIRDMRKHLLPQKAATAIHTRLQTARQNERSVADFGKEITELFVDLTISQADGNTEHCGILRPLNEKLAIKRFADGLRNSRLSTIIAARNYSSLKDAIQAAQEEEMASSSTAQVTAMSQRPPRGHFRLHRGYRGQRGQQRGRRGYQGQWITYNSNGPPFRPPRPYNQRGNFRGRSTRGGTYPNNRSSNVHTMTPQQNSNWQQTDAIEQPEIESLNHFFRT